MVFGKISEILILVQINGLYCIKRSLLKYVKAKLDIEFLKKYKLTDVYPKVVR